MNENQILAVYGKSGFGREVMPLISKVDNTAPRSKKIFLDDEPETGDINGHEVWSYSRLLADPANIKKVVIAIADGKIRNEIATKCAADGLEFMSVFSPNHVNLDSCTIGIGAIFSPFTMLTSNIEIGVHFHCNIYSYVAHDSVIGDFVTFAPGVKCNGNVVIEDFAYIGTGAIIRQGRPGNPLRIGAGAVIGMGAVVTKDVAAGETVVGNPARQL